MDPIAQFKENQKAVWSGFQPFEMFTGVVSPTLVRFAKIERGAKVLDVGCGTGVASVTAARAGAKVTGLDLTPELLLRAKENASLAKVEIEFHQGDAEAMPFTDAAFDVVISQFGHMFAPRPDVVVGEMLRVLRPGGTIAFATWPPELFTGRMFALTAKYLPAAPLAGVSPPPQWGDPNIVRERLGAAVKDIVFDRSVVRMPMLSPAHGRVFLETNLGPVGRLVKALASDESKLAAYRRELEELMTLYFEDNSMRQDYLLTRAVKT
jgi:SAM-dependent methyltransferase